MAWNESTREHVFRVLARTAIEIELHYNLATQQYSIRLLF